MDRVYGCIVGGAIGDALGAPVEGWSYERIRAEYGKVETFRTYDNPHSRGNAGSVTDDTVVRHYLCMAIRERGGRVTPDEFAEVLQAHLDPERVWITEEIVLRKLAAGINPWEAGRGNVPTGTATMAIAPVGVVNAANPRQAYQDGFNVASVNQDNVNRDTAATVAAGIAEALSPDASVESVVETMLRHSSDTVTRALELALELADESNTVDEFVERFYDELLDWRWPAVEWDLELYRDGRVFSADSVEFLPAVVGLLSLCGDEANRALVEAASFGRDCDTIASLTGNVVGALHGAGSIRDGWIEQCEAANAEFFDEVHGDGEVDFATASRWLVDALEGERQRAQGRVETLDGVLDGPPSEPGTE